MATKKKETRGRKKLPPGEILTPVTILIKTKNKTKAIADCAAIAARYR